MTAETRDELHTVLDAVLDYIERTGEYTHFWLSTTCLRVHNLDGVRTDQVTAETTKKIIDALEADANPQD